MVVGIVLSGGFGKRLRPLTDDVPKGLLEISKGLTIMDKQLYDFKYSEINEIYLLIGYKSEKIRERYGDEWKGLKLNYLVESTPMGTLWALNNCLRRLSEDSVVRNGDTVADFNIKELINFAQRSEYELYITLTKMKSPYGVVETLDTKVTKFVEKPLLDKYINAGIYYIKKSAYPYFEKQYNDKDIEKTVFPELVTLRKVGAYIEDNVYWQSVDSLKDLETVKKEYEQKEDKPWGYEKILVNTDKYMVKELYIRKGFQTSMHYHPNKDETMHLIAGAGYILFENGKKSLLHSEGVIRIEPKVVHSIVATENLILREYSTPHVQDTVRVHDYYER